MIELYDKNGVKVDLENGKVKIDFKYQMKKFILYTRSKKSGNRFSYFIEHRTRPNDKEITRFLDVHGVEARFCNEEILEMNEVKDRHFLTIPEAIRDSHFYDMNDETTEG